MLSHFHVIAYKQNLFRDNKIMSHVHSHYKNVLYSGVLLLWHYIKLIFQIKSTIIVRVLTPAMLRNILCMMIMLTEMQMHANNVCFDIIVNIN